MEPTTRAIVLPIFRRYWLWHAWQEAGSAAAGASNAGSKAGAAATSSNMLRSWRDGVNIEEKTQLLGQQATRWVGHGANCAQPRHASFSRSVGFTAMQCSCSVVLICEQRSNSIPSALPVGPKQAVGRVAQAGGGARRQPAQPGLQVRPSMLAGVMFYECSLISTLWGASD